MNPEIPRNTEKQNIESSNEGLVDLAALSFDFCTEDLVGNFYTFSPRRSLLKGTPPLL